MLLLTVFSFSKRSPWACVDTGITVADPCHHVAAFAVWAEHFCRWDVTGNSKRMSCCQCFEQQQLSWILNHCKYSGYIDTCFLKAIYHNLCCSALPISNAHQFYLIGHHNSTSTMFQQILNLDKIYLKGAYISQIQMLHFVCQVRCNTYNCNTTGSSHLNNPHIPQMRAMTIMH